MNNTAYLSALKAITFLNTNTDYRAEQVDTPSIHNPSGWFYLWHKDKGDKELVTGNYLTRFTSMSFVKIKDNNILGELCPTCGAIVPNLAKHNVEYHHNWIKDDLPSCEV